MLLGLVDLEVGGNGQMATKSRTSYVIEKTPRYSGRGVVVGVHTRNTYSDMLIIDNVSA